jgi:hypothetical protein
MIVAWHPWVDRIVTEDTEYEVMAVVAVLVGSGIGR